jgi:hypothetical protein
LTFAAATGTSMLAAADAQPVIVSRALGRGQVIVSGALDAWRYREAGVGFSRFWTTLAWDAAAIAGPRLRVDSDRVIAQPGAEVEVKAELQSMTVNLTSAPMSAAATVDCDGDRRFLRLWPAARPASFRGTFRADRAGHCEVEVSVNGLAGSTAVAIRDDLQRLPVEGDRLQAVAAAYGAIYVTGENSQKLVSLLAQQPSRREARETVQPMRSPLWLIPFVLCLSLEWWQRRRSGLR